MRRIVLEFGCGQQPIHELGAAVPLQNGAPIAPAQPSVGETITTALREHIAGLETSLHVLPSQWRMVPESPTAQPSSLDSIVTERRYRPVGLATSRQAFPSQCRKTPSEPTAQPSSADTIATERSSSSTGLGT